LHHLRSLQNRVAVSSLATRLSIGKHLFTRC
jgi:hypothetical protein